MTATVIQGSFLTGQPKLSQLIQAKLASPVPGKPTLSTRHGNASSGPLGPPAPAFSGRAQPLASQPNNLARPPGPPEPAFNGRAGPLQRKGTASAFAVEAGQLGLESNGGRPLPDMVRSKMQAALRADFSNIRVYVGPQAERIGAIAFTLGADIYFAPGRYQPDTMHGQQLLGHELAHVVQQRAGRVRNPLASGLAVVQDHALEAEADRLGRHAAAFRSYSQPVTARTIMQRAAGMRVLPSIHDAKPSHLRRHGVMQRMMIEVDDPGFDITEPDVSGPDVSEVKGRKKTGGKDRSNQIVELMQEQITYEQMRTDVVSVCDKVQEWAARNKGEVRSDEVGRDLFFYNKSAWAQKLWSKESTALFQLQHWNAGTEPVGDTVAMLMDFALAWKHSKVEDKGNLDAFAEDYARRRTEWRQTKEYSREKGLEKPLSKKELERKYEASKKLVTEAHSAAQGPDSGFNPTSDLAQLAAAKGYQISAGPSSSTASLLWFLRRVGRVTQREAKSVTRALAVEYWGQGLKNASTQFHTRFEATVPLARHLSKFNVGAGSLSKRGGETWEELEF
jgi:hypothetical protein